VTTNPTTGTAADGTTDISSAGTRSKTLGQDQFLALLVTQLQHQDPTQPMDDMQFIAQLAQFSSLEQMQQMNTTLSGIAQMLGSDTSKSDSSAASTSSTKV
jgi:flagellar basal-body rod modification protein FlgD